MVEFIVVHPEICLIDLNVLLVLVVDEEEITWLRKVVHLLSEEWVLKGFLG